MAERLTPRRARAGRRSLDPTASTLTVENKAQARTYILISSKRQKFLKSIIIAGNATSAPII